MPESLEDIKLRSEVVQDILTKVPHWMVRWGSTVFLIIILLLFGLSWVVKYPDIIVSEALITTEVPPQRLYAKSNGSLTAILVRDNALVSKGQPLAVIENSARYQDVFRLKRMIDTLNINRDIFYVPFDDMPLLVLGDIDAAYALFENSYLQYRLHKELQPYSNDALANRYALSELNNRLGSLRSQKTINKTELDFKIKDLKRYEVLFAKGIISEQDYENKQLELAQAKRNYEGFKASISQIKESIAMAHKASRGTKINKVKEDMGLLKTVIQSFNQLKKAIKDWEQLFVLKSLIDGRVSFLNYWNTNQTVQLGDLVFTVIPNQNSAFIAKLKTPAQNAGKIKTGQVVNIKLEHFPDTEFGVLKGQVTHISTIPDKHGYYVIDVALPKVLKTSYNKLLDFKQDMPGSAEIITEDLRLMERFFYQFRGALDR